MEDSLRRGGGTSKKAQAARTFFSVSLSSVKRYVNKAERGEPLGVKQSPGSAPKLDEKATRLLEGDLNEEDLNEGDLKERPSYATPSKRAPRLHTRPHGAFGEPLDESLPRRGPEYRLEEEKGGRVATERDGFRRAFWRASVAAVAGPESPVFVDEEMGVHTALAPVYGYAPKKGERLRLLVYRATALRTRRCFRARPPVVGWGHPWPWKGLPHRPGIRDLRREGARANPACE